MNHLTFQNQSAIHNDMKTAKRPTPLQYAKIAYEQGRNGSDELRIDGGNGGMWWLCDTNYIALGSGAGPFDTKDHAMIARSKILDRARKLAK